jgi:hypothetical protein
MEGTPVKSEHARGGRIEIISAVLASGVLIGGLASAITVSEAAASPARQAGAATCKALDFTGASSVRSSATVASAARFNRLITFGFCA